jgi:hypothetical protein
MSPVLEAFALKIAAPAAGVVLAAAGIQATGVEVTATDLGVAAVCLFVLDRVLNFARGVIESRAPREAAPVPPEVKELLKRNVEVLEEVRDSLRAVREPCPLKEASGQREIAEAIADQVELRQRAKI